MTLERDVLWRCLIGVVVVFLAVSSSGQGAPFLLEAIEVRNSNRIASDVIASESRLRIGHEYTEEDVREAVRRLARLPYLSSVEYAIERGSDESRRVIVITVQEVRPLSFLGDGRFIFADDTSRLDETDYDYSDPTTEWKDVALGLRWLVGGHGYAHAAMSVRRSRQSFAKNYTAWEYGYTHRDLFGTGIFATVVVQTPVDSVEERTLTPAVTVGLPLTTNQTLSIDVEDTVFVRGKLRIQGTEFRQLHAENTRSASWTYDTTDGVFVRSRGAFARVTAYRWMRDDADFRSSRGSFEAEATHVNANGVDVAALRYWERSTGQSLFAGVLAGWAKVGGDAAHRKSSYEVLKGGYSRRLGPRDARVELEARLVFNQWGLPPASFLPHRDRSVEALASWAWKGRWGAVRVGAGYARGF
jgi:hypothetical protein